MENRVYTGNCKPRHTALSWISLNAKLPVADQEGAPPTPHMANLIINNTIW